LIKEYCDKCQKEIGPKDTRITVIVNGRDKVDIGHEWNYSEDILCGSCAANFTIHATDEVSEKKPE